MTDRSTKGVDLLDIRNVVDSASGRLVKRRSWDSTPLRWRFFPGQQQHSRPSGVVLSFLIPNVLDQSTENYYSTMSCPHPSWQPPHNARSNSLDGRPIPPILPTFFRASIQNSIWTDTQCHPIIARQCPILLFVFAIGKPPFQSVAKVYRYKVLFPSLGDIDRGCSETDAGPLCAGRMLANVVKGEQALLYFSSPLPPLPNIPSTNAVPCRASYNRIMQPRNILHGRNCLPQSQGNPLTLNAIQRRRGQIYRRPGVCTLSLPLFASFYPHPLVLSLSLVGLAGLDQSIVVKSTCVKTKRSLGLGPPITRIVFDGIPDD